MEKYKIKLHCSNCGYSEEKELPKGTKRPMLGGRYLKCPNCGCDTLK